MKLIGITGKAGAGKTTFSDYLAQNSKDIGIIHVDDLIKELKLKYFKFLMKKDNKGEKVKVDSRLKKFLYKNKIVFSAFMKFRTKLISHSLERRINELSDKRIILIDDIFIKYHKLYNDLEKIYVLERAYTNRREALIQRDGISKEEIMAYDLAHYRGNYKEIKGDIRVTKIENDGDKEKLKQKARKVYEETLLSDRESMLKKTKVKVGNRSITISRENRLKENSPRIKKGEFLK